MESAQRWFTGLLTSKAISSAYFILHFSYRPPTASSTWRCESTRAKTLNRTSIHPLIDSLAPSQSSSLNITSTVAYTISRLIEIRLCRLVLTSAWLRPRPRLDKLLRQQVKVMVDDASKSSTIVHIGFGVMLCRYVDLGPKG